MFQNFEANDIIIFLEGNNLEDDFLLELYKRTKQPEKAYNLLKKLYTNSSNPDYLAQQAIIEFELAEDKNSVLASVIEKFNISLKTSSNPIYQNYLAYLLIDYDIDIPKGLVLVKKALEQDPTNIAFIDTLAWGDYKSKNCKDAYKNMKLIVDEIGLNDEEIKIHWEKIKECKENDTRKNK
jgi:tetratricopeptide (TPR) repeat protein